MRKMPEPVRNGNREYYIDIELNEQYHGYILFLMEDGKDTVRIPYLSIDYAEEYGHNWIHNMEQE